MNLLRLITIVLSAVAHTALAVAFVADYQGVQHKIAFFEGEGDDQLRIDAAISIEGVTNFGTDIETVQAVDVEPQEARPAVEAVEEVKPVEKVEEPLEVISAKADLVEESVAVKEVKEAVKPEVVEQAAQAEQVVLKEMVAASGKQEGGDTSKRDRHFGKISAKIRKHVINPRTRLRGTAVVKFSVDPSGQLLSREILKSSGSKRLDRAALDSILRAAPFPPFPEGSITQAAVLKMKFNFSTR